MKDGDAGRLKNGEYFGRKKGNKDMVNGQKKITALINRSINRRINGWLKKLEDVNVGESREKQTQEL